MRAFMRFRNLSRKLGVEHIGTDRGAGCDRGQRDSDTDSQARVTGFVGAMLACCEGHPCCPDLARGTACGSHRESRPGAGRIDDQLENTAPTSELQVHWNAKHPMASAEQVIQYYIFVLPHQLSIVLLRYIVTDWHFRVGHFGRSHRHERRCGTPGGKKVL
jgi:hypothetical protein